MYITTKYHVFTYFYTFCPFLVQCLPLVDNRKHLIEFYYAPKKALTDGIYPGTKVFVKCLNKAVVLKGSSLVICGYDGNWIGTSMGFTCGEDRTYLVARLEMFFINNIFNYLLQHIKCKFLTLFLLIIIVFLKLYFDVLKNKNRGVL